MQLEVWKKSAEYVPAGRENDCVGVPANPTQETGIPPPLISTAPDGSEYVAPSGPTALSARFTVPVTPSRGSRAGASLEEQAKIPRLAAMVATVPKTNAFRMFMEGAPESRARVLAACVLYSER